MKVGGCYNVTGLPEYSSEIGFRVDRERREEQLLWAENIRAKHFPLADYSTLQNSQDETQYYSYHHQVWSQANHDKRIINGPGSEGQRYLDAVVKASMMIAIFSKKFCEYQM